MVRNPKAYKVKRGGGRAFSRDLSRLDADGNAPGEADSSSEEESSSEESEEDNRQNRVGQLPPIVDSESEEDDADMTGLSRNLNSTLSTAPRPLAPEAPTLSNSRLGEMTAEKVAAARKERKAAAANKGGKAPVKQSVQKGSDESSEASEAEENENHRRVGNMKPSALAAPRELSRREKEAAAKEAAKERYAKLHAAGKTDEAKADLGRLAEVRRNRELAAAKRIAETAAKDEAAAKAFEKSGKKGPLKR